MLRDEGRAEELSQDVLLDVWRAAGTFEGRSPVSTWVFGIAHHKAVNVLRARREERLDEEVAVAVADEAASPLEETERRTRAERLKGLLARLSPEHREVLELTYQEGLPIAAIAQILNCPVNTVKTRMFYARQRLKQMLGEAGEGL